jgi:hypothetical protein
MLRTTIVSKHAHDLAHVDDATYHRAPRSPTDSKSTLLAARASHRCDSRRVPATVSVLVQGAGTPVMLMNKAFSSTATASVCILFDTS